MKKYLLIIVVISLIINIQCKKEANNIDKSLPTQVLFKSLTITKLNLRNMSNDQWDIINGPELYFKITNDSGTIYFQSDIIAENVDINNLPLQYAFSTSLNIKDLSENLYIELWDYDNDSISKEIDWSRINLSEYKNVYFDNLPKTINIKGNSSNSDLSFAVEWKK